MKQSAEAASLTWRENNADESEHLADDPRDPVASVFRRFAGDSHMKARELYFAFKALGLWPLKESLKAGEDASIEEKLSSAAKLLGVVDFLNWEHVHNSGICINQFKKVIERASRLNMLTGVLKDASHVLAFELNSLLPPDLDTMTLNDIQHALQDQTFISTAANHLFQSIRSCSTASGIQGSHESGFRVAACDLRKRMNKFRESGGTLGSFGDIRDIEGGLEAKIGLPDPRIFRAILHEHMYAPDSMQSFETSNYNLLTCPKLEFALLLGNKDEYWCDKDKSYTEIPLYLMEVAQDPRLNINGPTLPELNELKDEFRELKDVYLSLRGCIPGAESDSYVDTQLSVSVTIDSANLDDASACKQLEDFLLGQLLRMQSLASLLVFGRRITALSPASHGEGETQMKISVPCALDEKDLELMRNAIADGLHLNYQKVILECLGSRMNEYHADDPQQTPLDSNKFRVLRKARKLRSIRELMQIAIVRKAKLRVEEAIVAYQYTGPLYQVL